MKRKYRVNNLSTELLKIIINDNYRRFTSKGETIDYWDQKEEIDNLLYSRRIKQQEEELKERESQEAIFERLQELRTIKINLDKSFKYYAEQLMLIYCELYKIGLTEEEL